MYESKFQKDHLGYRTIIVTGIISCLFANKIISFELFVGSYILFEADVYDIPKMNPEWNPLLAIDKALNNKGLKAIQR